MPFTKSFALAAAMSALVGVPVMTEHELYGTNLRQGHKASNEEKKHQRKMRKVSRRRNRR